MREGQIDLKTETTESVVAKGVEKTETTTEEKANINERVGLLSKDLNVVISRVGTRCQFN